MCDKLAKERKELGDELLEAIGLRRLRQRQAHGARIGQSADAWRAHAAWRTDAIGIGRRQEALVGQLAATERAVLQVVARAVVRRVLVRRIARQAAQILVGAHRRRVEHQRRRRRNIVVVVVVVVGRTGSILTVCAATVWTSTAAAT